MTKPWMIVRCFTNLVIEQEKLQHAPQICPEILDYETGDDSFTDPALGGLVTLKA